LKLITSNCYKAYFHQNMNCNPLIFMGMRLPWSLLGVGTIVRVLGNIKQTSPKSMRPVAFRLLA
jgi:hypothetical protein